MDFAPVYLIQRFFYRFIDFFHHWYVDGSRAIGHQFIETLANIDRTVALKITLRYFFQPLYRDYSIIGRILGIIFRSGRVVVGVLFYLLITILFAIAYLAWLAVPAVILYYVARNL
jgi:hypothetical protein